MLLKTHRLIQHHQFHLSAQETICLYPLCLYLLLAFITAQPHYVFKTYSHKSHTRSYLDNKKGQNIQNKHSTDFVMQTWSVPDFCPPGLQSCQTQSRFPAGSLQFHLLIIPLKLQRCYSEDKHIYNHHGLRSSPDHQYETITES